MRTCGVESTVDGSAVGSGTRGNGGEVLDRLDLADVQ
jgi:hypothetical protein